MEEIDKLLPTSLRKALISAFIIWQLAVVTLWLMPVSHLRQSLLGAGGALERYAYFTGSWQDWDQFAPSVININVYLAADIVYRDGSRKTWAFLRDLGPLGKPRLWTMIGRAHQDVNSALWPHLARFAAISNNSAPRSNPVVHVDLIRHWQLITPLRQGMPIDGHTFYRADYPPGSLDR